MHDALATKARVGRCGRPNPPAITGNLTRWSWSAVMVGWPNNCWTASNRASSSASHISWVCSTGWALSRRTTLGGKVPNLDMRAHDTWGAAVSPSNLSESTGNFAEVIGHRVGDILEMILNEGFVAQRVWVSGVFSQCFTQNDETRGSFILACICFRPGCWVIWSLCGAQSWVFWGWRLRPVYSNARGSACNISAMSSAGPTKTVSSMCERVLTSDVVCFTACEWPLSERKR